MSILDKKQLFWSTICLKVAKGNHEVKLPMNIVSHYKVLIEHLHLSDTAHVNYNLRSDVLSLSRGKGMPDTMT